MREETTNLAIEESNLFLAYIEDILLQGVQEMKIQDNLWYLDTGASSHMTGMRSYFQSIDEDQRGLIRFGNESSITFEGKRIYNGELFRWRRIETRWRSIFSNS